MSDTIKTLAKNRRAKFEYTLADTFEAGMVLKGSEVKSLRGDGNVSLADAYVELRPEGAVLLGLYIAPYAWANRENHEPRAPRRLLLNKHELSKLGKAVRERGMTIIPVHLYFKGSRVKIEIALAKGKKLHDKRESIKRRDIDKQLRRIK